MGKPSLMEVITEWKLFDKKDHNEGLFKPEISVCNSPPSLVFNVLKHTEQ